MTRPDIAISTSLLDLNLFLWTARRQRSFDSRAKSDAAEYYNCDVTNAGGYGV